MEHLAAPFQGYAWPRGGWQKNTPIHGQELSASLFSQIKTQLVSRGLTSQATHLGRDFIGTYEWQPQSLLDPFDMTSRSGRRAATEHAVMQPAAKNAATMVLLDCARAVEESVPHERCWNDWYNWHMSTVPRLLPEEHGCVWNSIRIDINHLKGPHRDTQIAWGIPSFAKVAGHSDVILRLFNSDISELNPGTSFEDVRMKPGDIMIFDSSWWHEFRYTQQVFHELTDWPHEGRYMPMYMAVVLTAETPRVNPIAMTKPAVSGKCAKCAKQIQDAKKDRNKKKPLRVENKPLEKESNIIRNKNGTFHVRVTRSGVKTQKTVKTLKEAQRIRNRGW
jgi:hypothetical protein